MRRDLDSPGSRTRDLCRLRDGLTVRVALDRGQYTCRTSENEDGRVLGDADASCAGESRGIGFIEDAQSHVPRAGERGAFPRLPARNEVDSGARRVERYDNDIMPVQRSD